MVGNYVVLRSVVKGEWTGESLLLSTRGCKAL